MQQNILTKDYENENRPPVHLQLHDVFKILEIEHTEEGERLAHTLLNFIAYLDTDDELLTPWYRFKKLNTDVVMIETFGQAQLTQAAVDNLVNKRILKMPY